MQQVRLSEAEVRVYEAVSVLETRGQVPYPDLIAEEAGLTEQDVHAPCASSPRRACCTGRTRRWPDWTSAPAGAPASRRERHRAPPGGRTRPRFAAPVPG